MSRVVLSLRKIISFVFTLIILSTTAWATNVEMLHILRPKTDLQLRLETIKNARDHIDYLTYHHDDTESAHLIMEALRLAALRGVKVRYIYDDVATSHIASFSNEYMANLERAGVQIKTVNLRNRLMGFGAFKLIHSKLVIADAPGVQEIVISGGRNGGDRYIQWLDNTYIFKFSQSESLNLEIAAYYNKIWNSLKDTYFDKVGKPSEKLYDNEPQLRIEAMKKYGSELTEVELKDYTKFLYGREVAALPKFKFDSSEIQFVDSGIIDKIYGKKQNDRIAQAMTEILNSSKKVSVSTILFSLAPEKERQLKEFVSEGKELVVMTNSSESFPAVLNGSQKVFVPTLAKMQEEQFSRVSADGAMQAFVFRNTEFDFNHSKFVIGDKAVLITSSNNNYASDKNSEENGFLIKSEPFADYMNQYAKGVQSRFFSQTKYSSGKKMNLVERSCALIFRNIF